MLPGAKTCNKLRVASFVTRAKPHQTEPNHADQNEPRGSKRTTRIKTNHPDQKFGITANKQAPLQFRDNRLTSADIGLTTAGQLRHPNPGTNSTGKPPDHRTVKPEALGKQSMPGYRAKIGE